MIPLKQRNRHRPDEGIYGDCHRAAIASILELPLDDVPHFLEDNCDSVEFAKREREFLVSRGIVPISIAFDCDLPSVFMTLRYLNPTIYYILGGESRTGVNHSVVCRGGEVVHDPSLNNAGIVGPCKPDGHYWVTYFGAAIASRVDNKQGR